LSDQGIAIPFMSDSKNSRICIPLCRESASEMARALTEASAEAGLVELRLDCLQPLELAKVIPEIPELARCAKLPLIITLRAADQGGHNELDRSERIACWKSVAEACVNPESEADLLFDLELDLLTDERLRPIWDKLGWKRIISSYHDFTSGSLDLHAIRAIYDRLAASGAGIIKIAVSIADAKDLSPIFELLEVAEQQDRKLIAIGMGGAGLATRVLAPARGGFCSFASLNDAESTAPGQLTVETLRSVYRFETLNRETKVAGLIGSPVLHSLSPVMHNAAFGKVGLNAIYLPFEVADVIGFFNSVIKPGIAGSGLPVLGFSVTIPHKTAVMQLLDWIEPVAKSIAAVNTVVVREGNLHGYNTDVTGFIEPLKRRIPDLRGIRAAVIGGGGAARGVLWSLGIEGAESMVFARDTEKSSVLAREFNVGVLKLEGADFTGFDIVINTSPLGTIGAQQSQTVALSHQLRGVRLAYDLVYTPKETVFMREASQAGCTVIGGIEMLVSQAMAQFQLWTGIQAPAQVFHEAAWSVLNAS
jgi:3-dehydroquinate dehydratase/shikimate dehydrogenase